MLIPRLVLAALAVSALASTASAAPPILRFPLGIAHPPNSKDHTPLIEACNTYQAEFVRAAAQMPPSPTLAEAQRLDRDGVRYCDMQETRVNRGVDEIGEALHMIGVQPSL
jgi:hypothetical protein